MRLVTGKVIEGKVVVEGDALKEGSTVTVLAPEDDGGFELTAEQEELLLQAIREAEQGDFIDGEQFLKELDERG
jgi:hypothetical protein